MTRERWTLAVALAAAAGAAGALFVRRALADQSAARSTRLAAAELKTRVAELQLENLRAQLCPHFLFNALNTASALVTVDAEAAESVIAQISDLLRIALKSEGVQEVPFEQDLVFAEKYLAVEQVRLGGRLTVQYDIDAAARSALSANFLLQPIIENAVHHGIAPRRGGGRIDIAARRQGPELCITVLDDGPGLPPGGNARTQGIGLRNTRARLAHLYGGAFRFELRNRPEGGVAAEVAIPYRHTTTTLGPPAPGAAGTDEA